VCINCSVSRISIKSAADNLNVGLLLQLAVTAMGLFTLLAVVIMAVVMCRRSSASIGVYSKLTVVSLLTYFLYLFTYFMLTLTKTKKTHGKESSGVGHFPAHIPTGHPPPGK